MPVWQYHSHTEIHNKRYLAFTVWKFYSAVKLYIKHFWNWNQPLTPIMFLFHLSSCQVSPKKNKLPENGKISFATLPNEWPGITWNTFRDHMWSTGHQLKTWIYISLFGVINSALCFPHSWHLLCIRVLFCVLMRLTGSGSQPVGKVTLLECDCEQILFRILPLSWLNSNQMCAVPLHTHRQDAPFYIQRHSWVKVTTHSSDDGCRADKCVTPCPWARRNLHVLSGSSALKLVENKVC